MRLWVRLTFGQTAGQVDIWSDEPPGMRLWVRLIFGQPSGQVDIWSDVPPAQGSDFSEMLQKYFLKYSKIPNPKKISTKSFSKRLRTI